jgi:hypothetical protein
MLPPGSAVNAAHPVQNFKPNTDFVYSLGWSLAHANRGHVNNDGWVNDQDYDPNDQRPLLAIVGDSFIEALMVPYRDTIQGRLAAAVGTAGRVYSFALSGAPLSQYIIWAEYGVHKYKASGLVVNISLRNGSDFAENLMQYENWPGRYYFVDDPNDDLILQRVDYTPTGLMRFLLHSALARYILLNLHLGNVVYKVQHILQDWKPNVYEGHISVLDDPARVAASQRAISAFLKQLPERTSLPPDRILLLYDGVRPELYSDENAGRNTYFDLMRRRLLQEATMDGYETIDLQPVFVATYRREKQPFNDSDDLHWNSRGHAVAADAVMHSRLFSKIFTHQNLSSDSRVGNH